MDSNKNVSLEIPNMLSLLIEQCETRCVAQCCGLEAFNFSPLNIAFFFTVNELKPECISKENVIRVKKELKNLQKNSLTLTEDKHGDIGFLKAIKRPISRQQLKYLCEEIEHNIDVARNLVLDMQTKRYKKP
jgi:hypothetical protein